MSLLLLILLSKFGNTSPLQAACTALHSWYNTKQLFFGVSQDDDTHPQPKKSTFLFGLRIERSKVF